MVVVGVQQFRCGMAGQGCQRRVGSESVPCPTWAEQRLANRVSSPLRGRSKKDPGAKVLVSPLLPRCLFSACLPCRNFRGSFLALPWLPAQLSTVFPLLS